MSPTIQEQLLAKRGEILSISDKHGAYDVRIFGSAADAEDPAPNDIDLLVKYRDKTSPWFPASLKLELEDLLGHSVDIVTEGSLHPLLRDRILRQARPL